MNNFREIIYITPLIHFGQITFFINNPIIYIVFLLISYIVEEL